MNIVVFIQCGNITCVISGSRKTSTICPTRFCWKSSSIWSWRTYVGWRSSARSGASWPTTVGCGCGSRSGPSTRACTWITWTPWSGCSASGSEPPWGTSNWRQSWSLRSCCTSSLTSKTPEQLLISYYAKFSSNVGGLLCSIRLRSQSNWYYLMAKPSR